MRFLLIVFPITSSIDHHRVVKYQCDNIAIYVASDQFPICQIMRIYQLAWSWWQWSRQEFASWHHISMGQYVRNKQNQSLLRIMARDRTCRSFAGSYPVRCLGLAFSRYLFINRERHYTHGGWTEAWPFTECKYFLFHSNPVPKPRPKPMLLTTTAALRGKGQDIYLTQRILNKIA